MKILILSDTHRYLDNAAEVIKTFGGIKDVIHLGDVVEDVENLKKIFPDRKFYNVAGNNDFSGKVPFEMSVNIGGKKFLLVHGHRQRFNYGVLNLIFLAQENGADAALFGHTHSPFYDESMGVAVFNPGSISLPRGTDFPTFGIAEITEGGRILFETYKFISKGKSEKI